MSDEVQTASQGCHRIAAAFYYKSKSRGEQDTKDWHTQMLNFFYKSKSRGEQDTRETEMLILKVKGTARSRIMKPNQYRHLFCFESMKNYIAIFVKSHIK